MEAFSNKPRSRRSTPHLADLHITPLTRDPLVSSPFIDDDDHNPFDSQPRSYLSSRSLPQTPSILSRSPSRTRTRSRSRSHRRNAKSMLTLTSLLDDDGNSAAAGIGGEGEGGAAAAAVVGGPYTPGPYGPGGAKRAKSALASGRQTPGRVRVVDRDRTDFLLRTASLLVENASESKGQGWISKRNSSTSLAAHANGNGGAGTGTGATGGSAGGFGNWAEFRAERDGGMWNADDEYSPAWSRADANDSRRGSRRGSVSGPTSRYASRRASRVSGAGGKTPGGASTPREGYFDSMSLEFADEHEWDESSSDEEIDEGELKKLLRGRVGGFFEDIFGGWLDFRGEEDDDEDDSFPSTDPNESDLLDIEEAKKRLTELQERRKLKFAGVKKGDIVPVKPPSDTGGTWSDTRWFIDLARRALL